MSNAARVDELWDPSAPTEPFEPFLETNRALQAVLTTTRPPVRTPEVTEFEFLGERIAWTRDGVREFPEQVAEILDQIAEFATLPNGWDSYNGRPTVLRAVRPSLELIFETHRRCQHPRAIPLSGGGIGLRWASEAFELDVDVWSDHEIEALLTERATAEEVEMPMSGLEALKPLLDRFLSQP